VPAAQQPLTGHDYLDVRLMNGGPKGELAVLWFADDFRERATTVEAMNITDWRALRLSRNHRFLPDVP
jgi:hypothetical protein